MKYIAVDGGCYAGKTTTIEYLKSQGVQALGELRMRDGLPEGTILSPDLDGYKTMIDGYINAEGQRTERINTMRQSDVDILVADRGMIYSTLAAQDFALRQEQGNPADRRQAFEYGAGRLAAAATAGQIVLPDCMVIMTLTDEKAFYRRSAARGLEEVPGPPFQDYEPNFLLSERAYVYSRAIWGDSAAKVEIRGGEQKEEVGAMVLKVVQDLPPAEQPLVIPREMYA